MYSIIVPYYSVILKYFLDECKCKGVNAICENDNDSWIWKEDLKCKCPTEFPVGNPNDPVEGCKGIEQCYL